MAFCRGKNQKLLFKVDSKLKFFKFYPTRPEGAEALSPGQRPGLLRMIAFCPYRRLADKPFLDYQVAKTKKIDFRLFQVDSVRYLTQMNICFI